MKKIILTGVTGQISSYFADYLLEHTDHLIFGTARRLSVLNHKNIEHLKNNDRFQLLSVDLNDHHSLYRVIEQIKPDYFINCAAQSSTVESWLSPVATMQTDCIAIIHILEAIRKLVPACRFCNIGSSLELGTIKRPNESTNPYASAKIAAHQIINCYRHQYKLYAIQPIIHNSESPRRSEEFLSRKVTLNVARIYHALKNNQKFEPLILGNIDGKRSFNFALDIVVGVWRCLNQDQYILRKCAYNNINWLSSQIKDYVLGGEIHSVREFVTLAFETAGIKGTWINGQPLGSNSAYNSNEDIFGILQNDGVYPILVTRDKSLFRNDEDELINGDCDAIKNDLGWKPKTTFKELISQMVKYDIENYKQ